MTYDSLYYKTKKAILSTTQQKNRTLYKNRTQMLKFWKFFLVTYFKPLINDLCSIDLLITNLNSSLACSKKFYKNGQDKLIKNYGIGAQIIKTLNIKKMILVTRSRKKVVGLDGYDIKITKQEIIK